MLESNAFEKEINSPSIEDILPVITKSLSDNPISVYEGSFVFHPAFQDGWSEGDKERIGKEIYPLIIKIWNIPRTYSPKAVFNSIVVANSFMLPSDFQKEESIEPMRSIVKKCLEDVDDSQLYFESKLLSMYEKKGVNLENLVNQNMQNSLISKLYNIAYQNKVELSALHSHDVEMMNVIWKILGQDTKDKNHGIVHDLLLLMLRNTFAKNLSNSAVFTMLSAKEKVFDENGVYPCYEDVSSLYPPITKEEYIDILEDEILRSSFSNTKRSIALGKYRPTR